MPEPLAYYDSKKHYLYTKDRRKAYEGVDITPTNLDFNPFMMVEARKTREKEFPVESSNKEWNLHVDFSSLVNKEIEEFSQIMKGIGEHN